MNAEARILLKKDFPVVNAYKRLQTFVHGFEAEIVGVRADEDKGGIKAPVNIHKRYRQV